MSWILSFLPTGWVLSAIVFAVGCASGGSIAWKIQQSIFQGKELIHVQQHADETREALAMERKRAQGVRLAQDEGTRRLAALRADATRARDAVDGLRDATSAVLKHADTSLQACTVSAAALGAVFRACVAEYQSVGEIADGLDNDRRTLSDAWPQ